MDTSLSYALQEKVAWVTEERNQEVDNSPYVVLLLL